MKKQILVLSILIFIFLFSCTKNSSPPEETLSAPSNLILEQLDPQNILISWQDNSDNEDGFQIDRKIGESDWVEEYQTLNANSTTFIDSNLIIIGTYSYRVRAFRDLEFSEYIETSLEFHYNDVSSMYPSFGEQINLEPNKSFNYSINLFDEDGNPVDRIYEVWFKFLSKPEGTNINDSLFQINDSILVQANNGVATVILNSGTISGNVSLKTFTYNSSNSEISNINSNIIIVSGPPFSADISIGGINTAEDIGGGNWRIDVEALLKDFFGNPVNYGTAAYFSLPNNPEWAVIEPNSYVGNYNTEGDSIAGTCFTSLSYAGSHTNEVITITVNLSELSELEEFTLPIQYSFFDITILPQDLFWIENDPSIPDTLAQTFQIQCIDGQHNPINDQKILFTASLGIPVDMETDDDDDPFTEMTGVVGGNGRIDKEWLFNKSECPPPEGHEPGTISGTITISIPGTDVEEFISITLYRYPEAK